MKRYPEISLGENCEGKESLRSQIDKDILKCKETNRGRIEEEVDEEEEEDDGVFY